MQASNLVPDLLHVLAALERRTWRRSRVMAVVPLLALAAAVLVGGSPALAQDDRRQGPPPDLYQYDKYEIEAAPPASDSETTVIPVGGTEPVQLNPYRDVPLTAGLEAGVWVDAKINLDFSFVDQALAAINADIDAEDVLDIDRRTESPFLRVFWDSRWLSMRANYWRVHYTGSATIVQDFTFGNITVQATANTRTEIEMYSYLFHLQANVVNDEHVRFGFFLGARMLHLHAEIEADDLVNGGTQAEEEDAAFPLPQIGMDFLVRIGRRLEFHGRFVYFDADLASVDDVEGDYVELDAGVTFYPLLGDDGGPSLGLRVAFTYLGIDVDADDGGDQVASDLSLNGFVYSVIMRF